MASSWFFLTTLKCTCIRFRLVSTLLISWDRQNASLNYVSSQLPYLHSLTPCSTVLLEQLTGLQPVKKFPAFYGARRFITALTSARHLSLSWASSIQSIPPHPTSWTSILILSSHLRLGLPSVIFPSYYYYYYILTPRCRVLLEQLTASQPIKKFLTFYVVVCELRFCLGGFTQNRAAMQMAKITYKILLLQSSVRSHWPDTRDVWTDTESDDVSDSGVQSLPSSDSDAGIHDMKLVSEVTEYCDRVWLVAGSFIVVCGEIHILREQNVELLTVKLEVHIVTAGL